SAQTIARRADRSGSARPTEARAVSRGDCDVSGETGCRADAGRRLARRTGEGRTARDAGRCASAQGAIPSSEGRAMDKSTRLGRTVTKMERDRAVEPASGADARGKRSGVDPVGTARTVQRTRRSDPAKVP